MTPTLKTRKVNKALYANYLKRAEECHIVAVAFIVPEFFLA
jgi:hypothetical protein